MGIGVRVMAWRCGRGLAVWLAAIALGAGMLAHGQEKAQQDVQEPIRVELADGALILTASGAWEQVPPAFNMIEAEFKIHPEEHSQDKGKGRLTISASGGTIEVNLNRWFGQFTQPDGRASSEVATVEEFELDRIKVHCVDISGTYLDGVPGNPTRTERPGYRMLAAILQTPQNGNYYLKFYGPAELVAAHEEKFKAFVRSAQLAN